VHEPLIFSTFICLIQFSSRSFAAAPCFDIVSTSTADSSLNPMILFLLNTKYDTLENDLPSEPPLPLTSTASQSCINGLKRSSDLPEIGIIDIRDWIAKVRCVR
jgi:hypothetical protein